MEDIIKTCNPMVKFSKFTSNKKLLKKFEKFLSKPLKKKKKKKLIPYIIGNISILL